MAKVRISDLPEHKSIPSEYIIAEKSKGFDTTTTCLNYFLGVLVYKLTTRRIFNYANSLRDEKVIRKWYLFGFIKFKTQIKS